MNPERNDDRLKSVPEDDEEPPEVYGVVKQEGGFAFNRRTFLGGLAAGVLVSASGRGAPSEQPTTKPESPPLKAGTEPPGAPTGAVKGEACDKLKGHSSAVHSVAFSPDGKLLISGSIDSTIKLWALPEGRLLTTLSGHANSVYAVAISPDGKLLASGSGNAENTIKLWALPEGKLLTTLKGHYSVNTVAISPDGKLLASGSDDHNIKLWALPEGRLLTTLSGHANSVYAVAISPDGKLLASGSIDSTIKLWALPEGNLLTTLSEHSGEVYSIAISPDGKLLASGSGDTIKLWALPDGEPNRCLWDPAISISKPPSIPKGVGEKVRMYHPQDTQFQAAVPCGTPIPPGAVCTCDCIISTSRGHYWYPN